MGIANALTGLYIPYGAPRAVNLCGWKTHHCDQKPLDGYINKHNSYKTSQILCSTTLYYLSRERESGCSEDLVPMVEDIMERQDLGFLAEWFTIASLRDQVIALSSFTGEQNAG